MTDSRLMLNVQSLEKLTKKEKEAVGKFFRPQVRGFRLTRKGGGIKQQQTRDERSHVNMGAKILR